MEGCNSGDCRKNSSAQGLISVIGTGPGAEEHLTPAATSAVSGADVVIGYKTYLDLLPELLHGKEVLSSSMMQEVDRCGRAFELAESGKRVALISGGDPGIYAMAGLIYEMAAEKDSDVAIEVVPGIAAINGCAARLGAPLMHDFAAVSLSDLLTPWEVIEKRLHAVASADFVTALYNPKSKKRREHIVKARDVFLQYRPGTTVVGIVTGATRENETVVVTDLENMLEEEIGMQSTVLIGNKTTFAWKGKMITSRGYKRKYTLTDTKDTF